MLIHVAFWTFSAVFVGLLLYAIGRMKRELNEAERKHADLTPEERRAAFFESYLQGVRSPTVIWLAVFALAGLGAVGWFFG